MKREPVDHLGRPRRGRHDSPVWTLVRIIVGLGLGVVGGAAGLYLSHNLGEPSYVVWPAVGMLAILILTLLILERSDVRTGYLVIIVSFVGGLASVLLAYGASLLPGIHLG